jgi:predicted protein tyrosine phosphatase
MVLDAKPRAVNCFQILRKAHFRMAGVQAPQMELANEIIPRLWLGNRNAALDPSWLSAHNITTVFNATKDIPFADGSPAVKYRIPVDDNLEEEEIINMAKWSPEIIYNVLKEYQSGAHILIHCAAGVQRSAAITAMTLIALKGVNVDQAIAYIKSRRAIAFYPTPNFHKSIILFEQYYNQVLRPGLTAATATAAAQAKKNV